MSYTMKKLSFNTEKVAEVLSKKGSTKENIAFELEKFFTFGAKVDKPVKVTMNPTSDVVLQRSKYLDVIGPDNVAILNVGEVFKFFSKNLQKNYFSGIPAEYNFDECFSAWFGRVERYGMIDQNDQLWRLDTQTNKQAQDGIYTCVKDGYENKILAAMGFNTRKGEKYSLDGELFALLRKVKGQTMSTAMPFTERGLAPIRVENVRSFKSFEHKFHMKRGVEFTKEGKAEAFKYMETTTRPTDAVLYVIRETLAYFSFIDMGCTEEEAIRATLNGEPCDNKYTHKFVQGRGPAMKFAGIDVPLLKWANEIWASEGKSGNPVIELNDGTMLELTLENLLKNKIFALCSTDVMKIKNYTSEFFTGYSDRVLKEYGEEVSSELEAVNVVSNAIVDDKYVDLKDTVTLSRQITAPLLFNNDKDVERLCSRTLNEIRESVNDSKRSLDELGIADTMFGKMIVEDTYQAQRNMALFSKVRVRGTFAFAITEVRPILAKLLGCDDYMKHAKLHGSRCYFNARAQYGFCVDNRYPSLTGASIPMEIVSNSDSSEYCNVIQVLSLDSMFNDGLKGDYDGDTPLVTLPETVAAGQYLKKCYDLDWMYLPDDCDNKTCEEVLETVRKERTVDMAVVEEMIANM